MMNFRNNSLSLTYMTEEQIRAKCPAAYATEPTNTGDGGVTDKYVFAPTSAVIRDMEKLGWKVVDAKQRAARRPGDKRFSYHMVAFQNPEISITKTTRDGTTEVECFPRIILVNSHDGKSSFRFMAGLYRLVCSNGLVIASDSFADIRIRHINYSFDELRGVVAKAVADLPRQVAVMNDMQLTLLDEDDRRRLALDLLRIKRNDPKLEVTPDTIDNMLEPLREEDRENDLYAVFNVLQEKLTKGGFTVTKSGAKRGRKVKALKSFANDLVLNRLIFRKAAEYIVYPDAA